MLAKITITTDLISMALTLWLAFYLLARSKSNLLAMKAVFSLFAISLFFLFTYNNFFSPIRGLPTVLAILLILGMTCWYSVTYQLLSMEYRRAYQWMEVSVYLLSVITIILLIVTKTVFTREQGNDLFVMHLEKNPVYILYGMVHVTIFAGSFFNLLIDKKIRLLPEGRSFLITSAFPTLAVIYGISALFFTDQPLPRFIQDFFVLTGVLMLGYSVARYQSLVERRTILQEFPVVGAMMLALGILYIFIGSRFGIQEKDLGWLVMFVVTTHSLYDLGREFVERLRSRTKNQFIKKIYPAQYERENLQKLQVYLQEGLDHLCKTLNTSAGFVGIYQDGKTKVIAARNSVEIGSDVSMDLVSSEDVSHIVDKIKNIEWVTSAFEGQRQIAVLGIGISNTKLNYSAGDLELFSEFSDHVGILVSIAGVQTGINDQINNAGEESQSREMDMELAVGEMMETVSFNPDVGLIKMVEDALRKFSDFIILGQSPLAKWAEVKGSSDIERGKQVQKILRKGVETLRPSETRPPEPLPRVWYNYVVLHDAYIEGVMNREVMARLYISEGTFNRTRRIALRGVARWLFEANKSGKV